MASFPTTGTRCANIGDDRNVNNAQPALLLSPTHALPANESDALLRAVARLSSLLLGAPDFPTVLPDGFRAIGEAAGIHRVVLYLQHARTDGTVFHRVETEWCAPGIRNHAEHGQQEIENRDGQPFLDELHRGRSVWSVVEELDEPLRGFCRRLGIVSVGCVPVMANGVYIGLIAFDDCMAPRTWRAEIDALTTAANAIGAAVERREAERRYTEAVAREIRMKADREKAVLAERNRIARDIHDNLAQAFTAASLQLQAFQMKVKDACGDAAEHLMLAERSIHLGLAEARQSVMRLCPPEVENIGLPAALQDLVDRSSIPGLLACRLCLRGGERRVALQRAETALRVAQESIQNAIRHAQARNVLVTLEYLGSEMLLQVDDDGIGMRSPRVSGSLGQGMRFMRQRASESGSSLSVTSNAQGGVRVELRMPYDA